MGASENGKNKPELEAYTLKRLDNFTVTTYTFPPFFDAAKDAPSIEVQQVIAENIDDLTKIMGVHPGIAEENLEAVVNAAFVTLTNNPGIAVPAPFAFSLVDGLTEIAASANGKTKYEFAEEIGNDAALNSASRVQVAKTIITSVQKLAEMTRLVPNIGDDQFAKFLLALRYIEKKFTNFVLLDPVYKGPGNVSMDYVYMPGSEQLANLTNIHFNVGTLRGLPAMLGLSLTPEVSASLGDESVKNFLGEDIRLKSRPAVNEVLGDRVSIKGSNVFFLSEKVGEVDDRGIVVFNKSIVRKGDQIRTTDSVIPEGPSLFRKGCRYHLNQKLKYYSVDVKYKPADRMKEHFLRNMLSRVYSWVGNQLGLVPVPEYENISKHLEKAEQQARETASRTLRELEMLGKLRNEAAVIREQLQQMYAFVSLPEISRRFSRDFSNLMLLIDDETKKGNADKVAEMVNKARRLGHAMLVASRGEKQEREIMYLPGVVCDRVDLLSSFEDMQQIGISCQDPNKACYINAAPVSITQILQTLMLYSNNSRVKSPARVDVHVGTESLSSQGCIKMNERYEGLFDAYPGDFAVVRVTNSGMPDETRRKIFENGSAAVGRQPGLEWLIPESLKKFLGNENAFLRVNADSGKDPQDNRTEVMVYIPLYSED